MKVSFLEKHKKIIKLKTLAFVLNFKAFRKIIYIILILSLVIFFTSNSYQFNIWENWGSKISLKY